MCWEFLNVYVSRIRANFRKNKVSPNRDEYCELEGTKLEDKMTVDNVTEKSELSESNQVPEKQYGSVDNNYLINDADIYMKYDDLIRSSQEDKKRAFEILEEQFEEQKTECRFLWRYADAMMWMAHAEQTSGEDEKARELLYEACDHAREALQSDDSNPSAHKTYAILVGKCSNYESAQERIEKAYVYKAHIEKAIEIDDSDAEAYYLLGRWCHGVSKISWLERKLATTFIGEPPSATIDDALTHFMQANQQETGKYKQVLLYIAKCHIDKYDYTTALSYLDEASTCTELFNDEEDTEAEIDELLTRYSSYR